MSEGIACLHVTSKQACDRRKHLDGVPWFVFFLKINGICPFHCSPHIELCFPSQPPEEPNCHGQFLKRFAVTLFESSRPLTMNYPT